jgi:hypothetical protein
MPNAFFREELLATYIATALLAGVFGATFSSRTDVTMRTRQVVDILFLAIALLILLWALLSHFQLIPYPAHRVCLVFIILSIMASFIYCIYASTTQEL